MYVCMKCKKARTMITLNTFSCTNCFAWLREKCKIREINATNLYPTVTIEVRPNIKERESNDIPTIFTEVQELTFDKNGNPSINIANLSQSNNNLNSMEQFSVENRWAFTSVPEADVEDLQQNQDNCYTVEEDNSNNEVEETGYQEWKPSSHLHKYLRMMQICGAVPLAKVRQVPISESSDNIWKFLYTAQKAFFWTVVACTAFDLACQSKLWLLHFLSGDGFNSLVKFAYCLISLTTAIKFACLLCRDHDMAKMFSIITQYEETDRYEACMPHAAPALGIFTALVALALQIFSFGMWNESFLETILYSSHSMSQDVFLWNFKNMTSTNDQLFDQFFEQSVTNIFLGTILLVRDFLSSLFMGMVWDLILVVNLVLSCWKNVFVLKHANKILEHVDMLDVWDASTLQIAREAIFKKWRKYKIVYKFVNIVFGPFLPLFHVTNVLMYAFFLSICILPDEATTSIVYVSYLYDIAKAEFTYAISSRLTQQDEAIRKLIRDWGMQTGKITVDGIDWDLNGLLDEIDSEPMVFGTGNFAINQRFHFGIIGLVGSLFVSLANGIGRIST